MKKDLVNDYKLLKTRLGRMPMMMDFLQTDLRDPFSFVNYAKSYYSCAYAGNSPSLNHHAAYEEFDA